MLCTLVIALFPLFNSQISYFSKLKEYKIADIISRKNTELDGCGPELPLKTLTFFSSLLSLYHVIQEDVSQNTKVFCVGVSTR